MAFLSILPRRWPPRHRTSRRCRSNENDDGDNNSTVAVVGNVIVPISKTTQKTALRKFSLFVGWRWLRGRRKRRGSNYDGDGEGRDTPESSFENDDDEEEGEEEFGEFYCGSDNVDKDGGVGGSSSSSNSSSSGGYCQDDDDDDDDDAEQEYPPDRSSSRSVYSGRMIADCSVIGNTGDFAAAAAAAAAVSGAFTGTSPPIQHNNNNNNDKKMYGMLITSASLAASLRTTGTTGGRGTGNNSSSNSVDSVGDEKKDTAAATKAHECYGGYVDASSANAGTRRSSAIAVIEARQARSASTTVDVKRSGGNNLHKMMTMATRRIGRKGRWADTTAAINNRYRNRRRRSSYDNDGVDASSYCSSDSESGWSSGNSSSSTGSSGSSSYGTCRTIEDGVANRASVVVATAASEKLPLAASQLALRNRSYSLSPSPRRRLNSAFAYSGLYPSSSSARFDRLVSDSHNYRVTDTADDDDDGSVDSYRSCCSTPVISSAAAAESRQTTYESLLRRLERLQSEADNLARKAASSSSSVVVGSNGEQLRRDDLGNQSSFVREQVRELQARLEEKKRALLEKWNEQQ